MTSSQAARLTWFRPALIMLDALGFLSRILNFMIAGADARRFRWSACTAPFPQVQHGHSRKGKHRVGGLAESEANAPGGIVASAAVSSLTPGSPVSGSDGVYRTPQIGGGGEAGPARMSGLVLLAT
jgi:hypothetical protein